MSSEATTSRDPSERTDPGHGDSRGRLLGLTWAHLLNDGSANYLPGVLPAVLVSVHQPVRMAGVLIASLTIGQALQPAIGWVADRVGGRWMVALGLSMSSLGGALLGVTHNLAVLVLLLLLIGLGSAFSTPRRWPPCAACSRARMGCSPRSSSSAASSGEASGPRPRASSSPISGCRTCGSSPSRDS